VTEAMRVVDAATAQRSAASRHDARTVAGWLVQADGLAAGLIRLSPQPYWNPDWPPKRERK